MNEILECLIHGIKPREKYPPRLRAFCISLHCISPKAYNFVREKFGKNIPHPETIREWYRQSNLDATSGISKLSMDALKNLADKMRKDGGQLVACLIMDEMSIQRNMTWCRSTNKFIGLVDCGTKDPNDDFTLAKNALVYIFFIYLYIHFIQSEKLVKLHIHLLHIHAFIFMALFIIRYLWFPA